MQQDTRARVLFMLNAVERALGTAALSRILTNVGASANKEEAAGISVMQQAAFMRETCKVAGYPEFAAEIGSQMHEGHTLAAYVAQSSSTLRDAFTNAARFYKLVDATLSLDLLRDDDTEAMVVNATDGALLRHHRFMEFLIFALLARLRALAGIRLYPQSVCFAHETNADAKGYEQLAGCTVRFGSAFNGLVFTKTTLSTPFRDHDPDLIAYLSELGNEMLQRTGRGPRDIVARTERVIIRSLPGFMPSSDHVADALGMSRRSLTRKLSDRQTSFREITDRIRFDIAKTYLSDGLSMSEIAYYLGYADPAAFSTAFRRWAGKSPRAFRKDGL